MQLPRLEPCFHGDGGGPTAPLLDRAFVVFQNLQEIYET
jgi:hypothetical protein